MSPAQHCHRPPGAGGALLMSGTREWRRAPLNRAAMGRSVASPTAFIAKALQSMHHKPPSVTCRVASALSKHCKLETMLRIIYLQCTPWNFLWERHPKMFPDMAGVDVLCLPHAPLQRAQQLLVLGRPLGVAVARSSVGLYWDRVRLAESREMGKAPAQPCNKDKDAGSHGWPERGSSVSGLCLAPASHLRLWHRTAIYSFCLLNKY